MTTTTAAPAPNSTRVTTYVEYLDDESPPPPPPPKRKKMTKAERAELKRREEIEFRKLEITDHLRRELELSKRSAKKGKELWLQMCRDIKLNQMREELQSWETKTNCLMDQKDEKISSLIDDMEITEQMHKKRLGTQLQVLDYLSGVSRAFQEHMRSQYEIKCKEMLHDFYNKTCELSQIQTAYEQNFLQKLTATNKSLDSQLAQDYESSVLMRNDGVNDEILKRYNMRDSIAKKMNYLHKQVLEFLGALLNSSLDALKYEKVNFLMQRQRNFVNESHKLNEAESQNSHTLRGVQTELEIVEAEDQRKINDLKLEYAYFLGVHRGIELRMKRDREETHEKLKVLTTECYGISKSLRKLQKYGELLLSLSMNCRKLQTESEKVTLCGDFCEPLPEADAGGDRFQLEILDLKAHVDLSEGELQAHMQLLKNFWRRQALAEAQTVLLEHKKRELLKENQRYVNMIKSLSKAYDVSDLQNTLKVQSVLEESWPCLTLRNICL